MRASVGAAAVVVVALICLARPAAAQARAAAAVSAPSPATAPASASVLASALLPSADLFFGPPAFRSARLSPSGRWLAMTVSAGAARNALAVLDLGTQATPGKIINRFSDTDIGDFHWVNDERLVFDVIDRTEGSGDRRYGPGLFSVRRDGEELRQLVALQRHPFSETSTRIVRQLLTPYHHLLDAGSGQGDEVVVGEWRYTGTGEPDSLLPKRLNVITGRTRTLAVGIPEHIFYWLFDAEGLPRLALQRYQGREKVLWRAPGQDAWATLTEYEAYKAPWSPRYIDAAGKLYVARASGPGGTSVLTRFDFDKGAPSAEPLVSTPGFDFSGALVAETAGGRALGMRVDTDAETTVWFDPRLKALQADIDKRLPGHINRLECRRCDSPDMTVLVRSWSDRDPGSVWVWRGEPALWSQVGTARPGINPARMATLDFERFRARDGREVPVWITRPAGSKPGQPLPTVVLVHGGPWVRGGHWRFEPWAQFLASRGYLVVEPEYRGSTGYGTAHFQAGWKQWGLAMQDDVTDATRWVAALGWADPQRTCIAGASYGGYSALMGLVREPDLYRCGAAWVAVTDPRLRFKWSADSDASTETREYSLPALMGSPDTTDFAAVAPVEQADRIRAPLLLAFGAGDRRVPLEHGTRMREALRAAGREPEWVLYEAEGHQWQLTETNVDFARRLEGFLARNLR
jgi:dipeptidyl aminopeptidase/acylaminoacyl peptidase